MKILKVISLLLDYPDDTLREGRTELEAAKIGKPEERRAARVLREAGYRLHQIREGKARTRVYRKV